MIRVMFGYSESETRTKAERDATAARMLANSASSGADVPASVREVWGDSTFPAQAIQAWGLKAFLASEPHRLAVSEFERQHRLIPLRAEFQRRNGKK